MLADVLPIALATSRRRWRTRKRRSRSAPRDPVAHYAHGRVAGGSAATSRVRSRACGARVELDPRFVQAQHYLGILLGESGDDRRRGRGIRAARSRLDPDHARAWNNLGNAQRTQGRLDEAEASFARALALRPDYPLAAANLGAVQRDQGEVERAEATLRAALARAGAKSPYRPLVVAARRAAARARRARRSRRSSIVQAIKAAPRESGGEWFNLGLVLSRARRAGRGARSLRARARTSIASDLRGAARHAPDAADDLRRRARTLDAARAGVRAGLGALERELDAVARRAYRRRRFSTACAGRISFSPIRGGTIARCSGATRSSSPRHRRRARRSGARRSAARAGRRATRRVGFASAFFHVGTCGRYFRSWITDLDRDRFEVFVYHLFPGLDEVASAIAARADRFRVFGGSRARPSIVAPAIRDGRARRAGLSRARAWT